MKPTCPFCGNIFGHNDSEGKLYKCSKCGEFFKVGASLEQTTAAKNTFEEKCKGASVTEVHANQTGPDRRTTKPSADEKSHDKNAKESNAQETQTTVKRSALVYFFLPYFGLLTVLTVFLLPKSAPGLVVLDSSHDVIATETIVTLTPAFGDLYSVLLAPTLSSYVPNTAPGDVRVYDSENLVGIRPSGWNRFLRVCKYAGGESSSDRVWLVFTDGPSFAIGYWILIVWIPSALLSSVMLLLVRISKR